MRLNKYMSGIGFCSRREADRLIEAGKVRIETETAELGSVLKPGQRVWVEDRLIGTLEDRENVEEVVLALNKPRGIVCTSSDRDRAQNIVDFVDYPMRIYPVGRLDKDSEGLILMTNQGELVNSIMKSVNCHEKEYRVAVDRPVDDEFIRNMSGRVFLKELGVSTKPCKVFKESRYVFRIILTQGLNRQIRRMCEVFGYKVIELKRLRIINIRLGNLKTGEYRKLSVEELAELKKMLGGEANGRKRNR